MFDKSTENPVIFARTLFGEIGCSQHVLWKNKKNIFYLCTLISRPGSYLITALKHGELTMFTEILTG